MQEISILLKDVNKAVQKLENLLTSVIEQDLVQKITSKYQQDILNFLQTLELFESDIEKFKKSVLIRFLKD